MISNEELGALEGTTPYVSPLSLLPSEPREPSRPETQARSAAAWKDYKYHLVFTPPAHCAPKLKCYTLSGFASVKASQLEIKEL